MVWEEGSMEKHMSAPSMLEDARNDLDSFHDEIEIPEDREGIYKEGKKAETEFEKSLFYGLSATDCIMTEISSKVKELVNHSGRPEDIMPEIREIDEEYREYSREHIEKAEQKASEMFYTYDMFADNEARETLEQAENAYNEVLQYAQDYIENGYNLEMHVQKEVNRRKV